jgi:hypothetical protein
MALTQIALDKINNPQVRGRIAVALGQTEQSVINYIKRNDRKLTMYAVLEVIKTATGLSESEILETEPTHA